MSLEAHLEGVATGDPSSFDAVYDAASRRVLGLAIRILGDRAHAEEVAQEVFLQVWIQAARFDASRGSAMAWLLRMTHARAVDRVRASVSLQHRDRADAARASATPGASVQEQVEESIEADGVRRALRELRDVQREAIVLAYFGGMTQVQIADHLGVPLGTVKTRLRDGMVRLRRSFGIEVPPRIRSAVLPDGDRDDDRCGSAG